MEDLKTMSSLLNKVAADGYTEDFQISEEGLKSLKTEKFYRPEEVHIVNFYRFEGASDPSDSAIVYVIETTDGAKGTLTDAYGMYADQNLDTFITEVQNIAKKHTVEH